MTVHNDTDKLQTYQPGGFPKLGSEQRFFTAELAKLSQAVQNIVAVMKLLEKRMNDNGLT